ncbi:MAG: helix-turn-helix transcriptional regulator [Solirubrobacterales bacterium]
MAPRYRNSQELAGAIRELREERGLSQRELADLLELDPSAMNRIEKAERGVSTGELVGIAEALGVDVNQLLCADEVAYALRADCADEAVNETIEHFRGVIADYFSAEALAK